MMNISINNINIKNMLTIKGLKNISAKYSETLLPTFSISLPFNKKSNKVQSNATAINVKLKLLKVSMFFKSKVKKDF